jgi:hypothetical protein
MLSVLMRMVEPAAARRPVAARSRHKTEMIFFIVAVVLLVKDY